MDKITAFKNAQEFQEIFGVQEHGNGVKSRKNKILLSLLKSKSVWDYCRRNDDWSLLGIKNMVSLYNEVICRIDKESLNHVNLGDKRGYCCRLLGILFISPKYTIDNDGVCLDGSSAEQGFVRYMNMERNCKAYKMSAGKMFNHLLSESDFGKIIPQQVFVWVCEQLCEQWKIYVADKYPEYELCIGDDASDFSDIYDSDRCQHGDFMSCMVDEGFDSFYHDAVDCRAAWLQDQEGKIVSRCIIYDNVKDQEGNSYSLAERQYSVGGSDFLKRQLVDKLIKAKEINGYKQIGAGCGDSRAFVDCDGNSLSSKNFQIECNLLYEDTVSYQDSFKWYDYRKHIAYNYPARGSLCELDITGGYYEGGGQYDDYHDERVEEVRWVYYHGDEITCDVERMEDFIEYNGEYFHEDDIVCCAECGRQFPNPDKYPWVSGARAAVCSDLTFDWYCDEECLLEREGEEENGDQEENKQIEISLNKINA